MMLDAKRTFDALIERLAPDDAHARRGVRQPDLPAALERGRRLAGVHGDREALRARPGGRLRPARARHAAVAQRARLPRRAAAADGLLPAAARSACSCARRGSAARCSAAAPGMVFSLLKRVTGVDLLQDLSVFFRTLGGMIDGFTERADRVGALLEDPATTFLIVTSPRHDPVEEAIHFHRKLREAGDAVRRPGGQPRAHGAVGRRRAAARRSPTSSAPTWPAGRRRRRASSRRSPRATRRTSSDLRRASSATRRRSSCPSSTTTSTTSTGSRTCARTCSPRRAG